MDLGEQMVWAANEMMRRGLTVHTAGNVSARTEHGTGFYITPSSVPYSEIHPQDLAVVDWDGNPVSGPHPPSIEHNMHRLIYLSRPDVMAIVHTHSRYATTLAASKKRCGIPTALGEIAGYLGGPIPLAEYAPFGSMELARNAVRCLGQEHKGILLKNHGALAIGKDLRQALDFAELIEKGAESFILVQLLGGYDTDPEAYRLQDSEPYAR
jgi:L-fuculose-phosphate aldolase